jgi:HSP20 family protein
MNTQENNDTQAASYAPEQEEAFIRPHFRSQEDEEGATLLVALPGVKKEDLRLTLHESDLRIEAKRSDEVPEDWRTHRDSGANCQYRLNVHLTSRFDGTNSAASLEAGILTLQVPVREEAKPRQISVG